MTDEKQVRFQVRPLRNGSFVVTLLGDPSGIISGGSGGVEGNHSLMGAGGDGGTSPGLDPDPGGAVYYVVAVILMYGFSIVLMIASTVRRKGDKQHACLEDVYKELNKAKQQQEKDMRRADVRRQRSAASYSMYDSRSPFGNLAASMARAMERRASCGAAYTGGGGGGGGFEAGDSDWRQSSWSCVTELGDCYTELPAVMCEVRDTPSGSTTRPLPVPDPLPALPTFASFPVPEITIHSPTPTSPDGRPIELDGPDQKTTSYTTSDTTQKDSSTDEVNEPNETCPLIYVA